MLATQIKSDTVAARSRRRLGTNAGAYLFLLPALAVIGVFTLVPFIQGIILSFQSWDGIGTETPFVGFSNYQKVIGDTVFWSSMTNALIFGVVGLVAGNSLALAMAILVNKQRRTAAFFRTAYYVPGVLSVIVVGLVFSWLLDPQIGIVNRTLGAVGLETLQHNWLADPGTALPSVAVVFVWYHWGFSFLLFLAGLQDIPKDQYEAATLDGARAWAQFRYITWPELTPVTTMVSILAFLGGLQIFGTVQVLTNGGPGYHTEVPTMRIYKEAFEFQRYGTAAAMSVIFGICLLILALVQLKISRRSSGE
jgi:ABC-type sugar transport system permease subunit